MRCNPRIFVGLVGRNFGRITASLQFVDPLFNEGASDSRFFKKKTFLLHLPILKIGMNTEEIADVPDTPDRVTLAFARNTGCDKLSGDPSIHGFLEDYTRADRRCVKQGIIDIRRARNRRQQSDTFKGKKNLFVSQLDRESIPIEDLSLHEHDRIHAYLEGKPEFIEDSFIDPHGRGGVSGFSNHQMPETFPLKSTLRSCKGKSKVWEPSCIDAGCSEEQEISGSSQPVGEARVHVKKRLVRGGCISPNNIAKAAKKITCLNDAESRVAMNAHRVISISDSPLPAGKNRTRIAGKGLVSSPSKNNPNHNPDFPRRNKGRRISSSSSSSSSRSYPAPFIDIEEEPRIIDHQIMGRESLTQVDADEKMARELQEQLNREESIRHFEVDGHLARFLQQEEEAVSRNISNLTIVTTRGPRARNTQRPRIQAGNRSRYPATNRVIQLRRLSRGRPSPSSPLLLPTVPDQLFPFPRDMDLDVRMDILEALESAFGDANDFNENDYEMLLALDENNVQCGGPSEDQIDRLPLSTVQDSTASVEVCLICLDMPAIGDFVRHLPCLHKFHKHCIDPWLMRKTTCPVCRLSISVP